MSTTRSGKRQSATLRRAEDLAKVARFSARVRGLLEEAEDVCEALDRLGRARVTDAAYAFDCLRESTDAEHRSRRPMESFVAVDEALRGVIDRPGFEPSLVAM